VFCVYGVSHATKLVDPHLPTEIACYSLPYSGLGFASHVLTYYTVCLGYGRKPLWPSFKPVRYGKIGSGGGRPSWGVYLVHDNDGPVQESLAAAGTRSVEVQYVRRCLMGSLVFALRLRIIGRQRARLRVKVGRGTMRRVNIGRCFCGLEFVGLYLCVG
jgi:hypothetical protein